MSRGDLNLALWFYITDPKSVYEVWFEEYGREGPIAERRDRMVESFVVMLAGLQKMLDETFHLETFKAELRSPEDLNQRVPKWQKLFGAESALVAAQILYAYHREKRPIKRSDVIDFIHAMYLPHSDLWRGDRASGDLLIKHRVNFSDRIVPRLADLPTRVESELSKR
jgi:superoxide dismutase, Cu-Zn family